MANTHPEGTERRPNQSWTNIISVLGPTNPEPILNQSYGLIRSATVRLWFTYVRTHLFTFWFSRTNPEASVHFLVQQNRSWIKNACRALSNNRFLNKIYSPFGPPKAASLNNPNTKIWEKTEPGITFSVLLTSRSGIIISVLVHI